MFKFRITLLILCIGLLLVTGIQNSEPVDLHFLGWQAGISLVTLVFLTSGTGIVIGHIGQVTQKTEKSLSLAEVNLLVGCGGIPGRKLR